MKIHLATDHAGLDLKNSIKKPPSNGPITGPASNPNVQADIALLLFSFEKISTTNA